MISIICPIYNEEKYIANCLDSILQQDYPKNDMEVLLVDGMSTDNTRAIILDYTKQYPFIRLLDNPYKIVPHAMNIGIKESKGDVIIRLDAHASYELNYFSELVSSLERLGADNVGSVCKTDVLNKNSKTLAIKEVLSNKFGVGNSLFRTGISKEMEVDTVPFGCWNRNVFDKYGMYNLKLIRNQDIELNKRIIRGGGKIFIVPDTFCTYYAREKFSALSKNNYANGKWNILTVFYTNQFSSLSIRHFIPLLFVLSLVIPSLAAIAFPPFLYFSISSLLVYLLLIGSVCLSLSIKKKLNYIYLILSFIILHISYGWGSLIGIFNLPFLKK